jgi:hypothetical protein
MKKLLKTTVLIATSLATGAAFSQDSTEETYVQPNCADVNVGAPEPFTNGMCSSPTGTGASKRTDNLVYMGLVWSFGKNASKTPDVLIGLRTTRVNSSNSVKGADLSLRLQSAKNFAPEGVRLSYLGGKRSAMANIGAGYSFVSGSALITAAVQAAHVRVGTDYLLANQNFVPFFELNSAKRIQPTGSSYSCSTGTLRNVDRNISLGQPWTDFYSQSGLITPESSLAAELQVPYLPAGSKTCFEPVVEPV